MSEGEGALRGCHGSFLEEETKRGLSSFHLGATDARILSTNFSVRSSRRDREEVLSRRFYPDAAGLAHRTFFLVGRLEGGVIVVRDEAGVILERPFSRTLTGC